MQKGAFKATTRSFMHWWQYILSFAIILFSLLIAITFGHLFYCSIAGDHDMYSNMYSHYKSISKVQYDSCTLFAMLSSGTLFVYTLFTVRHNKVKLLYSITVILAVLVAAIILYDHYLSLQFTGKG